MTLLFMDGFHWPDNDWGFKYADRSNRSGGISAVTRRSGPGSYLITHYAGTDYWLQYDFTSVQDEITLGAAVKFEGAMPELQGESGFMFGNSTNDKQMMVAFANDGKVRVYAGGTSSTIATLGESASGKFTLNTWFYIEMQLKCHATLGKAVIKINGTEIYSTSGVDTTRGLGSQLSQYRLMPTASFGDAETDLFYVQDLYLLNALGTTNNDFLGDVKVEICRPTAPGTHTDFVPSAGANWENVDEVDVDGDTTYNQSNVISDKDTYGLSDITTTGAEIFGIQQQSIVRKTDASARSGKQVILSGSTEGLSDEISFNDSFTGHHHILELDPDTATSWDDAGINALESGITVTA